MHCIVGLRVALGPLRGHAPLFSPESARDVGLKFGVRQ